MELVKEARGINFYGIISKILGLFWPEERPLAWLLKEFKRIPFLSICDTLLCMLRLNLSG